jgi:hypothetical protein
MLTPTSTQLQRWPFLAASACAAAALALLCWLATSMPGRDTFAFGVVLLAAFGYPSIRAVRTLSFELCDGEDPGDAATCTSTADAPWA